MADPLDVRQEAERRTPRQVAAIILGPYALNEPLLNSAAAFIAEDRARARREALELACRDVCTYCGSRAIGYDPAEGPNEARNWTHTNPAYKRGEATVLCHASAIHARLLALAAEDSK